MDVELVGSDTAQKCRLFKPSKEFLAAQHNPPSQPQIDLVLDELKVVVKQNVSEEDKVIGLASEMCRLAWMSASDSKKLKQLVKGLRDVDKKYQQNLYGILEDYVGQRDSSSSLTFMQFWSPIVESISAGKDVMRSSGSKIFEFTLSTISDVVGTNTDNDVSASKNAKSDVRVKGSVSTQERLGITMSTEEQRLLHTAIKFVLLLYQHFQRETYESSTGSLDSDLRRKAMELFADILRSPELPKDCKFLVATCIAFHLNFHDSKEAMTQEFLDIYTTFCDDESCQDFNTDTSKGQNAKSTTTSNRLAQVALINGMLALSEDKHLWQIVQGIPSSEDLGCVNVTLFEWFYDEIVDLCACGEWQYHAFNLLQLWYNKATKYWDLLLQYKQDSFSSECKLLVSTLVLVWSHLDSPVDGVSESVSQVYRMMLALHARTEDGNSGTEKNKSICGSVVIQKILDKALQMAWHVKSKHGVISGLMTYVPISYLLEREPRLGEHLLECMATNFLAPCSAQVFSEVLKSCHLVGNDGIQQEVTSWIRQGLMSRNSLQKQNVNYLWLPACIKFAPEIFQRLLKDTQESVATGAGKNDVEKDALLYVLTSLLKSARLHHVKVDLPAEMLRQILHHADDDLRLDGFALTCATPKKSEPLTREEIDLLQCSLPYNMNNDNAPFRQQLQAHLRTILVRARDSAIAAIKGTKGKSESDDSVLNRTLEFLDWFWRLGVDHLHPGSNYQRLKTCLDWMDVSLDTLTFKPDSQQKKGKTPAGVARLLEVAKERNLLVFHSDTVVRGLLSCLLHGTDEIRECSGKILHKYIPWPLPLKTHSADENEVCSLNTCQLLESALKLCDNPKAYESEAGSLLLKLLFSKMVLKRGECYEISSCDTGKYKVTIRTTTKQSEPPALVFVRQLVVLLKKSLDVSKSNVVQAATTRPGHGLVIALQRCISECEVDFTPIDKWRNCMHELLSVCTDLLHVVIRVLGGGLDTVSSAPSFEQMGVSVLQAIADCGASDVSATGQDETILTCKQQMVMTWSWINIRQISVLLGSLVDCVPLGETGLIDVSEVQRIAQLFIGVLTGCRHRGAIEGCNVGFMKFCTRLLNHRDEQIRRIPGSLLNEVLEKVHTAGSAASVTRRSAGLPLIVQSIVSSEGKTKQHGLLVKTVDELLKVLSDPIPENQDQTRDLPHVHALNILKAVFREASIAGNAQPYVASTTIHAIDGFASPIWGVQNGAMQLFSTLLQRMLGQKKTKDDHLNTMTLQEFFVHFPALKPYFLSQLSAAAQSLQESKLHLNPTLYPILSILSKLSAGITQFDALDELREMVLGLTGSAILAVRELSASALPALIPKQDMINYLIHLASRLPEGHNECFSYNTMHGILLQLERLTQDLQPENVSNESLEMFADVVYSRTWIVGESNKCYITRAAYIHLVKSIHKKLRIPFTKELIMILYLELQMIQSEEESPTAIYAAGFDQFLRQLVGWRLEMNTDTVEVLSNLLQSKSNDLILASLIYLKLKLNGNIEDNIENNEDWLKIQCLLFGIVMKPYLSWQIQCDAFECLIGICDVLEICSFGDLSFTTVWERMNTLYEREKNSRLAGHAVLVMSLLIKAKLQLIDGDTHGTLINHLCDIFYHCSDPACADHLRINCARALVATGPKLLHLIQLQQRNKPHLQEAQLSSNMEELNFDSCLMKVIEATESLLVDENCDVRNDTARFVTFVTQSSDATPERNVSTSVIHPNVALEHLMSWTKYCDKQVLLKLVLQSMKSRESVSELITRETKTYVDDLFTPEEVNPFRERCVLHALRTQLVDFEGVTINEDTETLIGQECRDLSAELDEASWLLCNQSTALNVTCNKWVFDAIWTYVQKYKLCLGAMEKSKDKTMAERKTKVLSSLKNIADVSFVHPKLQFEIDTIVGAK